MVDKEIGFLMNKAKRHKGQKLGVRGFTSSNTGWSYTQGKYILVIVTVGNIGPCHSVDICSKGY